MLKSNGNLNGIITGDIEFRLSQYSDDTKILLDGSEQSLAEKLDVLHSFVRLSGLKLNTPKQKEY